MPLKDHEARLRWQREYYREHSKERLAQQKIYRINNKASIKESKHQWYINIGDQRMRKNNYEVKIEVLTHYGNGRCQCVMCGESRLACLTLDHIDGGGKQLRKNGERSGVNLCHDLKKKSYPKGYQTLCMNCQFCKAILDRSFGWYAEDRKSAGQEINP
jgi:hypothetical protein